MSNVAMRSRRKRTKAMCTIEIEDYSGILKAMTQVQRTAYVTRLLRQYLRRVKK